MSNQTSSYPWHFYISVLSTKLWCLCCCFVFCPIAGFLRQGSRYGLSLTTVSKIMALWLLSPSSQSFLEVEFFFCFVFIVSYVNHDLELMILLFCLSSLVLGFLPCNAMPSSLKVLYNLLYQEMPQQLRANTALVEDQNLVPSIHIRQLNITCNYSSRESNSWLPAHVPHGCALTTQTCSIFT